MSGERKPDEGADATSQPTQMEAPDTSVELPFYVIWRMSDVQVGDHPAGVGLYGPNQRCRRVSLR
ncbi:MAG: hypothetical protein ABMA00_20140, partial [Gemmatimonas sp.]